MCEYIYKRGEPRYFTQKRYRTYFGLLVCWLVIAAVDLWLLLTLFAPFWVGLLVCCLRERTNIGKLVRWLVVCFVSLRLLLHPCWLLDFIRSD